ncbi:glycosyltransferase family 4 protein [candidate division KSB1 bacterium]|nr:glycosyltransferase family 4 protein [candidate division KSB1 bacterium]
MKVLLLHQAFASLADSGGTRHYELARYCAAHGCEFHIITSSVNYLTGRHSQADQQCKDGVFILPVKVPAVLHKGFGWRIVAFLYFMLASTVQGIRQPGIDVVFGTTPPIFQSLAAWLIAAIRQKPFVLEVRDLWPEFAIGMGVLKNPVLIRLSRWLELFLYRRARHIIVNSPAYQDYLQEKGVNAERICLVANGVDPDMFHITVAAKQWREKYRLTDKFLVVYTGALGPANDIGTILKAAERLSGHKSVHFLLVGDGKDRVSLESDVKNRSLKNVTFTGAVPKGDIPALLSEADLCVATLMDIPMFRTTFPNKVFDYMAAGKTTVLCIDGVIRQVLERAKGGIYSPPGDAEALAENIVYCFQHPAELQQMGTAARRYVAAHFDRAKQAKKFMNIFTSMV